MKLIKLLFILSLTIFINNCVHCEPFAPNCQSSSILDDIQPVPHTRIKDLRITNYLIQFINDFDNIIPGYKIDIDLYSYRYESIADIDNYYILGECRTYGLGDKEIIISPKLYGLEDLEKAIIYHELGHCVLGLDHDESKTTLMSAIIYGNNKYWRDNWVKELEKFKDYVRTQLNK